jgi:pSer/pThr/pTyr-binding forkhead associated (FHA) protein
MTNESNTAALVVIKGPAKDKVFSLDTNLITVGRGEDANICLTGDTSISRIHLNLKLVNGRYVMTNRSDNGTLVNDRLANEKELQNGDRIKVGDLYLLEYSDGSKPVAAPTPSMFKKPAVLVGGGVYIVAMIVAAIFLSNAPATDNSVDSARVSGVLENYGRYMTAAKLPRTEQDARQRAMRAYLRSAFIAEREGNYPEARRIYLRVLDYTKDSRNPVYQYALERLRSVLVEQK